MSHPTLIRTVPLEGGGCLAIYELLDGKSAIYWSPSPTQEVDGLRLPIYLGIASTSELGPLLSGQARPSASV
jgi:hypothetical protein